MDPAQLTKEELAYYETLPPIALEFWTEQTGKNPATILRWRAQGFLHVENIAGRLYVTRAETVRFNRRLQSGEFAREVRSSKLRSSRNLTRAERLSRRVPAA